MTLHISRLPFSLDPLIAEAKRRMRRRRFLSIVLLVAGVSLGFGVAFTAHSGPGPGGGSPAPSAGGKPSNSLSPTSKLGEPPRPQTQPGYISYPSEGVRLGPPPEGFTPGLSAGEALRSFDRTGYGEFGGSSPPSVTLHTAKVDGKTFPAWVVTYPNTKPTSYGPVRFVNPSSSCNFVGVYNLRGGAWATFFQDCPQ